MGKNLIQQRRGRGNLLYRAPSHKYKGDVRNPVVSKETIQGTVKEFLHCPGHTAPLAKIQMGGKPVLMLATEGMAIGQSIAIGDAASAVSGNTLPLGQISEGTYIYNVENRPGDGGRFVRSGGTHASVVSHSGDNTIVQLPSGKFKTLLSTCRATLGVVAGGGRKEKPFAKAGKHYHAAMAKSWHWPQVRGVAMNPVDHPYGGGAHQHKGKPGSVKHGSPVGRKVGSVSPKRMGRLKR
ncbi:MAG: 50S ribosomal protein L2 [Candidatus Thermoplasmatota archaeon]|nr:50S ribosomal protein L2 [Candidatus Thermoplasmatota archaeon]